MNFGARFPWEVPLHVLYDEAAIRIGLATGLLRWSVMELNEKSVALRAEDLYGIGSARPTQGARSEW